jgi:predicted P-loop ATPase
MKFTIAKSKNPISKKFSVDDETGELVKNDGGNLTLAEFFTQNQLGIEELHSFISSDDCDDRTILIPGTTVYDKGLIITKGGIKKRENEDTNTHMVARSKDYFDYRGGDGFILLDYDPSTDYMQNDGEPLTKDELLNLIYEILPEIKTTPHMWKTSSSSCIENTATDELYRGIRGQHIFVHVKDSMDIERIMDIFYKRFWLSGHGYIFIDKTGGMHDRTIIDKVVNSPEREIFLKADCLYPAFQQVQYEVFNNDELALNTIGVTDLTIEEEDRFKQMVSNARDKRSGLATSVREDYVNKNHERFGLSKAKLNNCAINKVLYSDNPIKMSTGVEITVHDLFTQPELYDGEYCHDPLEPDYGGSVGSSTKAWIDINNRRIHSHAHGGITYDLEHNERKGASEIALEVCDIKDHKIMFKTAAMEAVKMDFIATEIDQLINLLAKYAGLKKGSCDKAFREHLMHIKGTEGKRDSVMLNLISHAIKDDGTFIPEMIQQNISAPITLEFPHTFYRGESRMNFDTVENFEFMTKAYGIGFSYDVVLKIPEIVFPSGSVPDGDNKMNASLSRLKSLCVLNGLGKDSVNYVAEMVNGNQMNPVLDWVTRVKWDGNPRLQLVSDNIETELYGSSEDEQVNIEFSNKYKEKVLRMWFLQCIAALDSAKNSPLSHAQGIAVPKYEHILVFVGNQGIQKTKFIKSLLPNELKQYILTGHELDVKDKDNIKIAISHWITELGELDSTFKKSDISSLKAFLSKEDDLIRMPYAASESKFIRRTSFTGTVNDIQFLVDKTGNRRYLPLHVKMLKPFYEIDIPNGAQDIESDTHIDDNSDLGINPTDENNGVDENDNDNIDENQSENQNNNQSETPKEEKQYDAFGREIEQLKPSNIISPTKPIKPKVIPKIMQDDPDNNEDEVIEIPKERMSDSYHTQQFWAEMYHYYLAGEQWWPDSELESYMSVVTKSHDRVDPTIESLEDKFDLEKNDEWRKINNVRGEDGVSQLGEAIRFVTLSVKDICIEIGVNHTDARVTNLIGNYLRTNGIERKSYSVNGKSRKAMRIALQRGETMSSAFTMPIHTNEDKT